MSTFSSTTTFVDNGKLVTSTYTGANSVATSTVTVQSNTIALSGNTTENANAFLQAVLEIPVVSLPTNMTLVTTNNSTLVNFNCFYNINITNIEVPPLINLGTVPNDTNTYIGIFNNTDSVFGSLSIVFNGVGSIGVPNGNIVVLKIIQQSETEFYWSQVLPKPILNPP
jgi:hypothetical protein